MHTCYLKYPKKLTGDGIKSVDYTTKWIERCNTIAKVKDFVVPVHSTNTLPDDV